MDAIALICYVIMILCSICSFSFFYIAILRLRQNSKNKNSNTPEQPSPVNIQKRTNSVHDVIKNAKPQGIWIFTKRSGKAKNIDIKIIDSNHKKSDEV